MAGFHFKLEAVLKHRRMIEEQKQRDLAKLLRQQHIYQSQLRDLQQTVTDDKRSMAESLTGQVNVQRIRSHAHHAGQVTMRIQTLARELLLLGRRIDAARAELVEATKAREAIDRLRQKQYDRWRKEQDRREARELDELGTQRFVRQQRVDVA